MTNTHSPSPYSLKSIRLVFAASVLFAALPPALRADSPPVPDSPVTGRLNLGGEPVMERSSAADTKPAPDPERGEFTSPSPIPVGLGFIVGAALDIRYRHASVGRSDEIWGNVAEVQIQRPITYHLLPRGNFKIQLIAEDPADVAHGHDIQVGEAYVLFKLPLRDADPSSAYLKVGQFQLPFALLAEYDPHLDLIQPLYPESLGLRTDWGIAISGRFYGLLTYDFSVTSGSGPNHADIDPNRAVCFRLGRTFITRNGQVNVGGSLLSGRLPVTDITVQNPFANELPASGRVRADRGAGFVSKTRIAGDGTYTFKSATARGEVMAGADDNNRVYGYFLAGDYQFLHGLSAQLARTYWVYGTDDSSSERNSIGLSTHVSKNCSVSALYEKLRDAAHSFGSHDQNRLTIQVLTRF